MQMKIIYRCIKLLCSSGICLFIITIAGPTEVVQRRVPVTSGCSLLDGQKPSVYLIRDTAWNDSEITRMILRNNSSCRIILTTTGKQTIFRPGGKISQSSDPLAEDGASVVLEYKVNSAKEPWAFITYWPYGDTVSTLTLNGGHSIKFIVPAEHLRQGGKIAVPFHYEWEGFLGSSGVEHLVYSNN
jgi:hypothetical protein